MSKQKTNFGILWQRNSIYGRLLRLYLLTVVVAVVGALTIYRNNVQLSYQAEEIISYRQFINTRSLYLVKDINQTNAFAYKYLESKNLISLQRMQNMLDSTLPRDLDSLRNVIASGNDKKLILQTASLRKDITQWQSQWEKALRYYNNNESKKIEAQKQVDLMSDKIRKQLINLSAGQETLINNALIDIQKSTDTLFFAIIYFSVVLLIAGFILGYFALRKLIRDTQKIIQHLERIQDGQLASFESPEILEIQDLGFTTEKLDHSLERLKLLAEEVGSGNFDTQARVFGGKGELGKAITGMRESLKQIAEGNRQRNWTNEGLTLLGDVLRRFGSQPEQLYSAVIRNLVEYTEVNQGAIFALERNSQTEQNLQKDKMKLTAGYAYQRTKQINREFAWGEGLIGQAWRERDTLVITDIPEDFPDIVIGVGEARPRQVIVSPLISNNEVFGIIEFASFKEIPAYRLNFIKQVGESIATTIARLESDKQTQKLLTDSQGMAERLSAQEEQMKQNVQELVETQEKMRENSAELEGQLQALSSSFIMMEYDLEGKILEVTDTLLKISGFTRKDLIKKHFSILLGYRHKPEQISEDWERILQGNYIQGEFVRYTKQGKPFWLFEVVYPTLDSKGKVSKIYSIAYDITTQKQQEEKIKEQLKELQMSKRDVVKRIREVEKKERAKLEKLKEEFQKKLHEKDHIINELKN